MAQKSKTQRAKASARRAAKKEEKARLETEAAEASEQASEAKAAQSEEPAKKRLFKKADKAQASGGGKQQAQKPEKKEEKKPKKRRFAFLKDVKAEMKRVTWPTRQEVLRWSGVVIVALLFFGIFAYIIDSISLLVLTGISGLGAN